MTTADYVNELRKYGLDAPNGYGKKTAALPIIAQFFAGTVANQLSAIISNGAHANGAGLDPETIYALPIALNKLQSSVEPPHAASLIQTFKNSGLGKVMTTISNAGADMFKSLQSVGPMSSKSETDQGTMEANAGQVNKDNAGDATQHTAGDSATATDGNEDSIAAEREVKTTSPAVVANNVPKAANAANKEIVAARTGFNDNRADSPFAIVDELLSMPKDILNALMYVDPAELQKEVDDGKTKSDNFFVSLVDDITKEVGKYTKMWERMNSESAIKRAEAVVKNKKEKIKKIGEKIDKMKEGPQKDKFTTAFKTLDFSILFSDPSSENKEKKSVRDKDEEAKIAAEATKKNIAAHAVQ